MRKYTSIKAAVIVLLVVLLSMQSGSYSLLLASSEDTQSKAQLPIPNNTVIQTVYDNVNTVTGDTYSLLNVDDLIPKPYKNGVKVIKELVDKRSKYSKTFQNDDNTTTMSYSNTSLHFLKNGKWENVNRNIREDHSDADVDYGVSDNTFAVKFGGNSNKPIQFNVGDEKVSFKLLKTNGVKTVVQNNSFSFPNAWDDMDVIYSIENDQLKMLMKMNNASAPKDFSIQMNTQHLTYKLTDKGEVNFYDTEGQKVFTIPQMWVKDSSNHDIYWDKLKVSLETKGKNAILNFQLDDTGLTYPLLIDPTVNLYTGGVGTNTTIDAILPSKLLLANITQISYYSNVNQYANFWKYTVGDRPQSYGINLGFYKLSGNVSTTATSSGLGSKTLTNADLNALNPNGSTYLQSTALVGAGNYSDCGYCTLQRNINITVNNNVAPATPNLNYGYKSDNSIFVYWSNTDYPSISYYEIYRGALKVSTSTIGGSNNYSYTGLNANTAYNLSVVAVDSVGYRSLPSNIVTITTSPDTTAPTIPTNLSVVSKTSNSISIQWLASTDYEGVTGYDIYRDSTLIGSTTSTNYNATALNVNTAYNFTVKARDAAGNSSAASSVLNATTVPAIMDVIAPSIPSGLISQFRSGTIISLSWVASTDNEGVVGYDIYNGGILAGSSISTSYSVTGLTGSTTYNLTVKARDAAGNVSAASNTLSITTKDVTAPTVPTNLVSPSKTSTTVSLSWTASTDNIGVTSYDIYSGSILVGNSTTTSYIVTGLSSLTAYSFTVMAKDLELNTSNGSSPLNVTTPEGVPPTIPTNLISSNITDTAVSLSWTESTDNVGVIGYEIFRGVVLVGSSSTPNYTVTGLTSGNSYSYTVKAMDAAGNRSLSSNILTITTIDVIAPTIPVGLSLVTNSPLLRIEFFWTPSADNVGVTSYDIYNGTTLMGSVGVNHYSATALISDTVYNFTVKARDAAGNYSSASSVLSVRTPVVVLSVNWVTYGTSTNPTKFNSTLPTINWVPVSSYTNTLYTKIEVRVLNEIGTATYWDSGQIAISPSNQTNWVLPNKLPDGYKLQMQIRVSDGSSWSNWSISNWFIVQVPYKSATYAYTNNGRLDSIIWDTGQKWIYNYDANGNQLGVKQALNYHVDGDILLNGIAKQGIVVTVTGTNGFNQMGSYTTNTTSTYGKIIVGDKANMADRIHYGFDLPKGTFTLTVAANSHTYTQTFTTSEIGLVDTGYGFYLLKILDDINLQ